MDTLQLDMSTPAPAPSHPSETPEGVAGVRVGEGEETLEQGEGKVCHLLDPL